MKHLFWLSDAAWLAIDAHLPHGRPGKPRVDDRRVISGILHVLKTGCWWRHVPAAYGPPTTICNRFNRWSRRKAALRPYPPGDRFAIIWQSMFEAIATGAVPPELSLDSTHVKDRRMASIARQRAQKGEWIQAIGRSRGGRTSKIHCLADDGGRPVAFDLTPGNIAEVSMAVPLLEASAPAKRLIADKAYNADSVRRWLRQRPASRRSSVHREPDQAVSARSPRLQAA